MSDLLEKLEQLHAQLDKRFAANRELVQWFGKQFGVDVETLGCVAEQIGRLDALEAQNWLLDLSEEDYEQVSRYVYNSVLSLAEDMDSCKTLHKEYFGECLEADRFKIEALKVRGHEGLEDMRNILRSCADKLVG